MASAGYVYEVSVRLLRDRDGQAPREERLLRFEHANHDDLFDIVARTRQHAGLDREAAAATAIGLKLLAETMLREKRNPLFDPLRQGVRAFIGALKARANSAADTIGAASEAAS